MKSNDFKIGVMMKGWKHTYDEQALEESRECEVEILKSSDDEITARVDSFKLVCPIVFKTPYHMLCPCESMYPCKHEAALMHHIENHPELLKSEDNMDELIELVDENQLREFLAESINRNPEIKDDFMKRFSQNSLDRDYYTGKLDRVFKSGEGRDFEYHGCYDLDMMALGLSEFMDDELSKLLEAGEHAFAAKLMERIAGLLSDELSVSHDSWYDLAEEFMEYFYIVSESIYLSQNERQSLEDSLGDMTSYL